MGRGSEQISAAVAATVSMRGQLRRADSKKHSDDGQTISDLEAKLRRIEIRMNALSDRKVPIREQVALIELAQASKTLIENEIDPEITHRAQLLRNRVQELFVSIHTGYALGEAQKYAFTQQSEDHDNAVELLLQEAKQAIVAAMDLYETELELESGEIVKNEMNPLSYVSWRIQAQMKELSQHGRLIRMKSKAHDKFVKVSRMVREAESEGMTLTDEQVATRLDISRETVLNCFTHLQPMVHLDEEIQGRKMNRSDVVPDPGPHTSEIVMDEAEKELVRNAVAAIKSPLYRRIAEMRFGLGEYEESSTRTLFDGVFVDEKGRRFSSEKPLIVARMKTGEQVEYSSAKELLDKFSDGKLHFEAGTAQSFELSQLRATEQGSPQRSPSETEARMRIITAETGMPLSSGSLDHALINIGAQIRTANLSGIDVKYRGPNEFENSMSGREQVRKTLEAKGLMNSNKPVTVSKLRKAAIEHNLIDEDGNINYELVEEAVH